ncbi:ornithine cyclodeaminase family protein [Sphingosinicella sp. LHD-64]|uniref:ornithine cyclodeaminase family protein n=1 Tax=Sphingosinicella sp. LHD-64 TaxID=3072139 RepID=UPI00280F9627|nr:ornithine cyclodeaminase family protein [Sphingosinicella sp. LHD-64]MDQ8757444.1 ornithine cyclodeaminase family protein [Sphingosinicella sp. LHD-64]
MKVIDAQMVYRLLGFESCIGLVREAMIALSSGKTQDIPRQIIPGGSGLFGIMAGAIPETFGAKLISVRPPAPGHSMPSHQGLVILFDPHSGAPMSAVDAGAITAIRTAAASAVATAALARPDARTLAILGSGEQARAHAAAIPLVRSVATIRLWGRDFAKVSRLAADVEREHGIACRALEAIGDAVRGADIICTTTAAPDPILFHDQVAPGAHINVVGSSRAGPAEIDSDLVARSRYFADCRANVLQQGAEFIRAREEGLVTDAHILAEIGEVLSGAHEGRVSRGELTLYKSLGHIVQDLVSARYVSLGAQRQQESDIS